MFVNIILHLNNVLLSTISQSVSQSVSLESVSKLASQFVD